MYVGILNKADYEYHQHINLWIKEGNLFISWELLL